MESVLVSIGLVMNIIGVLVILACISKMMKRIFGSIGAYSVDWITIEDYRKDAKKYSAIGMGVLIAGFVLQIIGTLL